MAKRKGSTRKTFKRKKPTKPKRKRPEADLQEAVVAYLEKDWAPKGIVFHHPLSNVIPKDGSKQALGVACHIGGKNKLMGVKRGMPDLCISIVKKYRGIVYGSLWIELKSLKGRVEPEQKVIHAKLRDSGHKVEVINNFKDAVQTIEEYLRLPGINEPIFIDYLVLILL